jgi:lipopolysaccharide export system permease protein
LGKYVTFAGFILKTLHKYLTGQVLAALLLTVAVFTFVVLLLNALKDILPLLFSGHAPLWLIAKAVGLLLPFAVVYALPMGFITATLLVFGRFSADQELTAARAGGVSLLSLITPVVLLSLLCCGLSAWFNMEIGPRSRVAFVKMRYEMLNEMANAQIPEGRFVRDFPGYIIYVGKKGADGELQDLMIYRVQNETNVDVVIKAASGRLNPLRSQSQLAIDLENAEQMLGARGNNLIFYRHLSLNLSWETVTNQAFHPKVSDMTFAQLRQEERDLLNMNLALGPTGQPVGLDRLNLVAVTNATPEQVAAQQAQAEKRRQQELEKVRVEMHREVAFSFACFGFTLVGIPLGIRVHRRETNIGIFIALLLVMGYYAFVMLGNALSGRPEWHPHLILWIPNFVFQIVGAMLLWRANRGI